MGYFSHSEVKTDWERGLGFSCSLMKLFGSFNTFNEDCSAERKADVALSVFEDQL